MRKKTPAISLMLILCFLAAGCASIVSKSDYPVVFNTMPSQATIVITDDYGKQVFQGTTPTTVTLKSGKSYFKSLGYTIEVSKPGYSKKTAYLKSSMDGWYIGNLLFGGLIGLLIVDPISGAMFKLPEDFTITLEGDQSALKQGEEALKIVSIESIDPETRKHLVRVN